MKTSQRNMNRMGKAGQLKIINIIYAEGNNINFVRFLSYIITTNIALEQIGVWLGINKYLEMTKQ